MEYVRIGHITKPFGLDGTLKVFGMTDFPKQRYKKGNVLSLLNERTGERIDVTVERASFVGNEYHVKFKEITRVEDAENYRNFYIEIDKENAPTPKGFTRYEDMKGCKVVDEDDAFLGTVKDIKETGVTNIVVEKEDGTTFYVPFVKKVFVLDINIETKTVKIKVIPGLL